MASLVESRKYGSIDTTDPKLEMGACAIIHIPCDCVDCTSILDKPWISGIPLD